MTALGAPGTSAIRDLKGWRFLSLSPSPTPTDDSDRTGKGSTQGLKTKAKWGRGDISDPVPSTFIVSHLLATSLSLLLLSGALTSSGKTSGTGDWGPGWSGSRCLVSPERGKLNFGGGGCSFRSRTKSLAENSILW